MLEEARYAYGAEQKKFALEQRKLEQFYGLQGELFKAARSLAQEYKFPDEYRLTDQQIQDYSKILMEPNAVTRYSKLDAIKEKCAYRLNAAGHKIQRRLVPGGRRSDRRFFGN